jgi:hypothetical protein
MKIESHSPGQRAFPWHRGMFQVLVVVLFALAPSLVPAANINFIDLTDTLSASGTQFEGGFTSSVNQETITFTGSWLANAGTTGSGIVYLVEPGTNIISDILRVSFVCASPTGQACNATITGSFESDVTGSLGTLPAGFTGIPETGALQNLTGLLQNPTTAAAVTLPANLTIFAQSDINETGEMPEPSSAGYLMIGGLALVGGWLIRRRE